MSEHIKKFKLGGMDVTIRLCQCKRCGALRAASFISSSVWSALGAELATVTVVGLPCGSDCETFFSQEKKSDGKPSGQSGKAPPLDSAAAANDS